MPSNKSFGRSKGVAASKTLPDYVRAQEYGVETKEDKYWPEVNKSDVNWPSKLEIGKDTIDFTLYCAHMDTRVSKEKIWAVLRNQQFGLMYQDGIELFYKNDAIIFLISNNNSTLLEILAVIISPKAVNL